MRVQATKPRVRFEVTADGDGLVGPAGAALLVELAERLGLPAELDGWRVEAAGPGSAPGRQGAGRLAVMLADGGDCLSDLAALRDQPGLFGPVASTPTAWRVLERLAGAGEQGWPGCGWLERGPAAGPGRPARGWTGCWSSTWTPPW